MTPEAQHKAIAEECGYYLIHDEETNSVALRNSDVDFRGAWHRAGGDTEQFAWEDAPDYLTDLNAMLEAEKVLTDEQHHQFRRELRYITGCGASTDVELERDRRAFVSATAAQRAEAFLRTLGKWEE